MSKALLGSVHITQFKNGLAEESNDLLAVEEPLEIRLGFGESNNRQQKRISVTMRTPGHDFELALGFLFTEGIISSYSDIVSIKYCTELGTQTNNYNVVRVELNEQIEFDHAALQRNFYTTSSCGVCGKASIDAVFTHCDKRELSQFQVPGSLILSLPEKLKIHQQVFSLTGGLHACALFDLEGNLIHCREDVGRHNALDKLIGAILGSNRELFSQSILLLSGRASFELLQKATMAGIPMVAAIGAPSSLAVETAKEAGITLVGFLRNERFNIYSGTQRIKV